MVKLLRTAKPNKKLVEIVKGKTNPEIRYKYKASTDGIEVILPERKSDWKMDVKTLLDECVDMMGKEFPFVKMKEPVMLVDLEANIDAKTKFLYDKSQKLKSFLITPNHQ